MRCITCNLKYQAIRRVGAKPGPQCPACYRIAKRGPHLKGVLLLLETLGAQRGLFMRATRDLGLSRSQITRWRNGVTNPSANSALALFEFCQHELIRRKGAALASGKSSPRH